MTRTARHLLIFTLVALMCGWVGILIQRVAGTPDGEEGPGLLFWLVAPLLTVIVLRWRHGGWKDAGLNPRLPGSARWYAIAVLVPLCVGGLAIGVALLTGTVELRPDWSVYAGLIATTIAFNLVKNVFEEFAWRGYLASRLLGMRVGDGVVYVGTGLVWGLWHVPYYLALLDGRLMENALDVPAAVFALLAMITIMSWTVAMVELFRLSGSVWPPLLLHTVHNTFVDPLGAEGFVSMPTSVGIFFSPIVGLGTAVLWLAVGMWLRRVRLLRDRGATPLPGAAAHAAARATP